MQTTDKIKEITKNYGVSYAFNKISNRFFIKYKDGKKYFPFSIDEKTRSREEKYNFKYSPLISILIPVFNPDIEVFKSMISSVMDETYSNYEVILADASDDKNSELYTEFLDKTFGPFVKEDINDTIVTSYDKIKYIKLSENKGISENTNTCFSYSKGDYIALMDHDDLLHPSALFEVVMAINKKEADFIYTDELSFDKTPDRVQSIHFKPQFSLELLKNNNYICHFTTFKRSLFEEVKGFRKEYDGSQDYDLFLRMTDKAKRIFHIPKVLYYWRLSEDSVATDISAKSYALIAAENAINDYLKSKNLKATVTPAGSGAFFNVRYEIDDKTKVLVITEDKETEIMINNSLESIKNISTVICAEANDKLLYDRLVSSDENIVIFVRKGIDKTANSLILNNSEWAISLMEALVPKNVGAASPLVKDEHKYLFAGYAYQNIKTDNLISLHRGRKINDPGYMNKLKSRQSVSLLGGMMLAIKKDYLLKILNRHDEFKTDLNLNDSFDGIFWLYLSYMISKNGKECITDPFSCITVNHGYKNKELEALKKYKNKKHLNSYHKKHCYNRMKKAFRYTDPMYNYNFRMFGKYYSM